MNATTFQVGDRVSKRSNPNKKGEIRKVTVSGNEVIYIVQYDDGTNGTLESADVIREFRERDPFSLLKNDVFHDSKIFRISNTIFKISNNLSNTISALKASRTLFLPYQYKPLLKFLQSDTKRILVADEVGLGKTIEAGHIILEMLIRDGLKNCLVIAKKSLLPKWQEELKTKFNLDFKLYENSKEWLRDLKSDGIANTRSLRGIVNYEKIRTKEFMEIIQEFNYGFDLVIMDEAQYIRNSSTLSHQSIAVLLKNSDNVVMLTATPVMTHRDNLHSLIKLLDETYEDKHLFNQAIEFNKPFVKALNSVNQKLDFDNIRTELLDSEVFVGRTFQDEKVGDLVKVGTYLKDDPLFKRLLDVLIGSWTPQNASKAQKYLQQFNLFHSLYTRTRKRDVQNEEEKSIRDPEKRVIRFTDDERALYNSEIDKYSDDPQMILKLMSNKKMITSCWPAFVKKYNIQFESSVDSKFQELLNIVKDVVGKNKRKILLFSFYTGTLDYLHKELVTNGYGVAVIHGGLPNRQAEIERFKNDPECHILLSSEVGNEGLDLQFCDTLVNYDLPWNPMVVEQRIGRIDRVGQKSKRLLIYNLIIKDSIEEIIYDRLLERIDVFRNTIGDLEAILDESDSDAPVMFDAANGLMGKLYSQKLTPQEQRQIADDARVAIETRRMLLNELEIEIGKSFANDHYIQQEIDRIHNNKQYITAEEICFLLSYLFTHRDGLPQFDLIKNEEHPLEYKLSWNPNDTSLLVRFLREFLSSKMIHPDLHFMLGQFERSVVHATNLKITFDQQYAFDNKGIEYIGIYHPLVDAAKNFFISSGLDKNLTFKYSIDSYKSEVPQGLYILPTIHCTMNRLGLTGKRNDQILIEHFAVQLDSQCEIATKEVTTKLLSASQEDLPKNMVDGFMFSDAPVEWMNELEDLISIQTMDIKKSNIIENKTLFQSELQRKYDSQKQLKSIQRERLFRQINSVEPDNTIIRKWESDIAKIDEDLKELELRFIKSINSFEMEASIISIALIEVR